MSIKDNFPSVGPSLSLNFARSKTLDPRITFSRSSVGTHMDENGLIVSAATDEPRFDYKYESGVVKSLGLLVEEQRTNILEQSVVTTSNWTGGTSNTTYSNLSLNALGIFPGVEVTSTTGEAWHRRTTGYNVPFVSGTEYAITFYYREGTSGYARLQFRYNSQESYVQGPADGSSWSIQQTIGSITNVTTTLMDGQSTYKTTYSFTPNFTGDADMGIGIGIASAGTTVIALGGQVEEGEFPTSYIPTSGSTKTRNPDNVTMTGTNFSDWYNQDEGTVYVSQKLRAVQDTSRNNLVYLINGGGGSDYFYNPKSGDTNIFVFGDGGTNYSRFQDGTNSTDTKTAFAYDVSSDDFKAYYNGIEATNETTTNTPSATSHTQLELGANVNDKYCGHIQQFVYYPKRLTNTQLQNLTK
tara:strand:- start:2907 stop:4142 length:1236 start_codon:yes stop_codon:yes gene_type:complete